MGNEKLIFYLRTNKYYSIFLIIMVTFFVIATKKVRSVILSVSEGSPYGERYKNEMFR
jgi:hypothetical protein